MPAKTPAREPVRHLAHRLDADADGYAFVTVAPRPTLMQVPPFDTMLSTLSRVDPLRVQAMVRSVQRIDLLLAESVITMMLEELLIR